MTVAHDPIRLVDMDSEVPDELVKSIREMRTDHGSDAAAELLARRLAATSIEPAVTTGAMRAPAARPGWLVVLIGIGLLSSLRMPPASPRAALEPQVDRPAAIAIAAQPVPSSVPEPLAMSVRAGPPQLPERAQSMPVHHPQRVRRRATPQPSAAPTRVSRPDPVGELVLLRRCEAALHDHDPETALAFTEQHADIYPKGVFEQEREILAIEALRRQHKGREALERAKHFLSHHAGSLYAYRVQTLLDQSPTAPSNREPINSGEQVIAIHAGVR